MLYSLHTDQLGNHPIVIKLLVILHIVASIFALVDIGLGE